MLVFGGRGFKSGSTQQQTLETLGDVWAFNLDALKWTLVDRPSDDGSPHPGARSSMACALKADTHPAEVFVFGGRNGYTVQTSNEVWKLTLTLHNKATFEAHWVKLQMSSRNTASPPNRFDHTMVAVDRGMVVYGGCDTIGSRAFSDLWLLEEETDDGGTTTYAWHEISTSAHTSPPPPFAAPLGGNWSNATSASHGVAPLRTSYSRPGARCAHSTVAQGTNALILFGGRYPFVQSHNTDATWQTLSDTWILQIHSHGYTGEWVHVSHVQNANGELLLNRSDHSAVLRNGDLLLFGGLFTDTAEGTIYIMKDFLRLSIPPDEQTTLPSSTSSRRAYTDRLESGPAWRFDHTMVVAPSITDPTRSNDYKLIDAPVLYGGGGGSDIFGDVWVYDFVVQKWQVVHYQQASEASNSFITSLLFGCVGFGLYTCVIVCVFLRKFARARRNTRQRQFGGEAMQMGNGTGSRAPRRGLSQDIIDGLPRTSWNEAASHMTKCKVATQACPVETATVMEDLVEEFVPPSSSDAADSSSVSELELPVGAAGTSTGGATSATKLGDMSTRNDDNEEVCPVCLSAYDDADVLIKLPCEHLFHEQCIARWLQQDSSCPQCRSTVGGPSPPLGPPAPLPNQPQQPSIRAASSRSSEAASPARTSGGTVATSSAPLPIVTAVGTPVDVEMGGSAHGVDV